MRFLSPSTLEACLLCAVIVNIVWFQIMSSWMSIIVTNDSRVWNKAPEHAQLNEHAAPAFRTTTDANCYFQS